MLNILQKMASLPVHAGLERVFQKPNGRTQTEEEEQERQQLRIAQLPRMFSTHLTMTGDNIESHGRSQSVPRSSRKSQN